MKTRSERRRDGALTLLNATIEVMNLAKEASSPTPAKAVFGSVSIILTMIRVGLLPVRLDQSQANVLIQDSMMNVTDYVDLGLACAEVCRSLDRGMDGKQLDDLSQSVREAINQLTT
jgi:hypothetical protein